MTLAGIKWKEIFTFERIKAIFEGCGNEVLIKFNANSDLVTSVAEYRLEMICKNCPLWLDGQCNPNMEGEAVQDFNYGGVPRHKGMSYKGCGCYLECKTANMNESCPLGKWLKM